MIHLIRNLDSGGGRVAPAMGVALACDGDGCDAVAGEAWCDAGDVTVAYLMAEWLRDRAGWERRGRRVLCGDCRRRPRPAGAPHFDPS